MSRVQELPPDQRAALSLLLRQHKSYAEVAALLRIPERAVHDRAHAALAVLAPREARALDVGAREQIGEYLLGQQRALSERLATRNLLAGSPDARAWAQRLAGELGALADGALPEIPPAASAVAAPAPAQDTGTAATTRTPSALPSSRLGGALLLALIVAGAVVAIVLLTGGGGQHKAGTASTKTASAGSPKIDARLVLKSPNPSSQAIALVEILSEGGKRAFYIAAEHLPPSRGFYYVIWLYNSRSSYEGLSVASPVKSNERLAGGSFLPENAGNYREMIVTRERTTRPTRPSTIVLRGAFSLSG
jgi:Sigma-70, region 4